MENNEVKSEVAESKDTATTPTGVDKFKTLLKSKCCANAYKNKKYIVGVFALLLLVGYAGCKKNPDMFVKLFTKNITKDQAKAKMESLITDKSGKVKVKDVTEESGLYKVAIGIEGQPDQYAYVTKDGTKFIEQAISFDDIAKQQQAAQQAAAPKKDVPKSDTPDVKLFVMSYCPYGTQMEKGILPVVQALGSKIKYALGFVDYSMHGDKEIAENLRQYCIEKTQPAKLSAYLSCFLKKGEGTADACMVSTGVVATQVSSCVAQTDSQFHVTVDAADKSKWSNAQFPPFNVEKADNDQFGVQGSPTLIINGVETQAAGRDAASILKTICAAFNNPPKECQAKLSTTAPAPGFGDGAAAAGSAPASCATPAQ